MYLANFQSSTERIRKYVARAHVDSEAAGLPLQYLLLDMSPVTHVDSTGEDQLFLFLNVDGCWWCGPDVRAKVVRRQQVAAAAAALVMQSMNHLAVVPEMVLNRSPSWSYLAWTASINCFS